MVLTKDKIITEDKVFNLFRYIDYVLLIKEKGRKDKQRSSKHTYKTNPTENRG
jgi:hypothetical protein